MLNLGSTFEAGNPTRVQTPQQGDPMLSPSGRLLVTRVKGAERASVANGRDVVTAEQSGYALHLVSSERQGDDWNVELDVHLGKFRSTSFSGTSSYRAPADTPWSFTCATAPKKRSND